jgi:xylulokinase
VQDVFSNHGELQQQIADELQLSPGIPVTYKAGDQPNNALSLNVLQPGEVAATAGTSGVVYAVTDKLFHDQQSRVNSFAHVNHTYEQQRIGVLLCINGTGILNKWMKQVAGGNFSYNELNNAAHSISPGSDGLMMLPFGNGAERMLNNKLVGAHIHNIDLNKHGAPHLFRAVQEGIAFAFRYGIDMMKENGLQPGVIKAGKANMFLSDVFTSAFVNATNIPVQLYNCDGSVGASIGAGIGAHCFAENDAFSNVAPIQTIEPVDMRHYDDLYAKWKVLLQQQLQTLK